MNQLFRTTVGLVVLLGWLNVHADNLAKSNLQQSKHLEKYSQFLDAKQSALLAEEFKKDYYEEHKRYPKSKDEWSWFGRGAQFTNLREDLMVPEHCRQTRLKHFSGPELLVFTVSTQGALERGFTYEYPLKRSHGALLYNVFRHNNHSDPNFRRKIQNQPQLKRDYQVLLENHDIRGFDFDVEGEVLELLVLVALEQKLEEEDSGLFVSGSVQYTNMGSSGAIGELDVILGDKINCEIVGYGEVKLGIGAIGKARKQTQRFYDFLGSEGYHPDWITPGEALDPQP